MNTDCWLWPDRTIGKRESRILREEHNRLINDAIRLESANAELLATLERIANNETRADRRHRGMVDISIVEDLQRIARAAIANVRKG